MRAGPSQRQGGQTLRGREGSPPRPASVLIGRRPCRGARRLLVAGLVVLVLLGSALTIRAPNPGASGRGTSSVQAAAGPSGLGCATVNTVGTLSVVYPASDSGGVGSYVQLQGSGFFTAGSIYIFFYPPGSSLDREVAFVPSGTAEPFRTAVAVPDGSLQDTVGVAEFWALDSESNCASAAFTITSVPPTSLNCATFGSAELYASPTSGPEGTPVTLVGNGFYPEGGTNLWWATPAGSSVTLVGSSDTGETTWTTSVTVPTGYASGTYVFWGVDGVGDCGSALFNLTGSAPLVAGTAAATPTVIDYSQQSALISPSGVSGGTPPYAYTWYVDSVATGTCGSSPTETALAISPNWTTGAEITGAGTYDYCYVVTDSASDSEPSGYATLTVNPTLSPPAVGVTPSAVNVGQGVVLFTTEPFSGGTGGFTCQWLVEVPGGSGWTDLQAPFACVPGGYPDLSFSATSVPGAYGFELQVTDGAGVVVSSTAAALTVATALEPTVAVSASPSTISLHESAVVSVTVGGSGPTPTGSVSVSDGLAGTGDSCSIPTLNSSGAGTCELQPSHWGALTVTALYSGDLNYAAGSGTAPLTVTVLDFTMSPSSGPRGQTLDVVLGGFTPVASGTNVSFGGPNSGVQVDSVTISGPSSITVQITIALNATLQADGVVVRIYTVWGLESFVIGNFRVTPVDLSMSPSSGTQDETLDILLAGFTPPSAVGLYGPLRVEFGGFSGVAGTRNIHVDSAPTPGLSNLTVQTTIGRHVTVGKYAVTVEWRTGNATHSMLHVINFGEFRVFSFAVTMSPGTGSQDESLYVALGGFTVAPAASDMTVTFGKHNSGIAVDSLVLTGLSSLLVEITIAHNATTRTALIRIVESVAGEPGTETTLNISGFRVVGFAVAMDPNSASQGSTLAVTLSGFTVAPLASDMTVTFGSASSLVAVDSVTLTGPSSVSVAITIAGDAPVGLDGVTVVESVPGEPDTFTTINVGTFDVTS